MGFKEEVMALLEKNKIEVNPRLDQHFLIDEEVISTEINAAELTKKDTVLEIGAGTGVLTSEIAKTAGKVFAFEKDIQFKSILKTMPKNVKVVFGDVMNLIIKTRATNFNKIVANIPYQICEPLIRYLIFAKNVNLAVLLVPEKFANSISENIIYTSFLKIENVAEVPAHSFYPEPSVSSAIIKITRRPDFEKDKDKLAFVVRKLYMQDTKKLKNGLRDALIDLSAASKKEKLTKKQADEIISKMKLDEKLLETEIQKLSNEDYKLISERIN